MSAPVDSLPPLGKKQTQVFFLIHFDPLKIPLTTVKMFRWLQETLLNLPKPLLFRPLLKEDGVALEAEMLASETYWDEPPIELNPVVPMFQRLTARKWEEYLNREETVPVARAD